MKKIVHVSVPVVVITFLFPQAPHVRTHAQCADEDMEEDDDATENTG